MTRYKSKMPLYIRLGHGVFVVDLAARFKLHPNTVRVWLKALHLPRGKMMGPHGVRKQAVTHRVAREWERRYRATGGLDHAQVQP